MQSKTWIKNYIGKAKKKIEKPEELDTLTASTRAVFNPITAENTIDFKIKNPTTRFFAPSNNGVHFPCL